MTVHTPPSWLQNGSHPAENDRLTTQALWATTGIIAPTSLAVTANSPVGMSVRVAAGWAAIVGTIQPNMGTYVAYNDATVTLTIATANPSNPRIDLVCMTVNDSYYTGALDNVVLQVVTGTPASSPVAPTLPANSIALATVAVAAAATSISSGNITDQRVSVTTNLPIGDITSVIAGTGLQGGGTSGAVTLAIDTTVTADLSTAQTLTNKTISGSSNTLSNIGNSSLTNSSVTIGSTSVSLGGTASTVAGLTLTSPVINLGVNAQSGTSYTTVLADNGKLVTQTNASAITTTIPPFASVAYATGAQITFAQLGAGQVIFAAGSGVTIVSTGATASAPKLRAQYSTATAICVSQDNWLIVGDIS